MKRNKLRQHSRPYKTVATAAARIVIVQKALVHVLSRLWKPAQQLKKMLGQLRKTLPVCKNQLINAALMAYNITIPLEL